MESQLKPVPSENSPAGWPLPGQSAATAVDQNKVLRNTYWLLALSMLPTITGAYVGMSINFAALYRTSPIVAPLLMFAATFGMLCVVAALRNSGWGVVAVFRFTIVAGQSLA